MTSSLNYIVVTPVRNEAKYLPLTISSLLSQTIRPTKWIIVDDGSQDDTAKIASETARNHPWITLVTRTDRGYRKAGGGVVDAFYEGYSSVERLPWDFLVKLDGDLSFEADYFERCFEQFRGDCKLGIAGGVISNRLNGQVTVESKVDPKFHVRGATKIYRRQCWLDIGGLIRAPGWDTLDEVKANMLGWTTMTFSDIPVIHHRPAGAAYGAWNDRVKGGLGCYISGYHPLFMLLKCLKRMPQRPYVIGACGFMFGYLKGLLTRVPQVNDKPLIHYFQKQQMNRLMFRKSLWR